MVGLSDGVMPSGTFSLVASFICRIFFAFSRECRVFFGVALPNCYPGAFIPLYKES
jgi:hypothetical protein